MILTENNALTKLAQRIAVDSCETLGFDVDAKRLVCVSVHSATDPRRTGYVLTTPKLGKGVGVVFTHLGDSVNDAKRWLSRGECQLALATATKKRAPR